MHSTLTTNKSPVVSKRYAHSKLDEHSVKCTYKRWANVYDFGFGGISKSARLQTIDIVNELTGYKDLLEIGVGTGLALPMYNKSFDITGIDLSSDMLEKAKQRVDRDDLKNVVGLFEMNAQNMTFSDNSFDLSVAMFTASVVPDAPALLKEMRRVVKPGGKIIFVNHFAAKNGFKWWAERSLAPLSKVLGWHPDFKLEDLLGNFDYKIELIECKPFGLFSILVLEN